MAFDVQNGVTGAVNGIEEKPAKTSAKKPETTTNDEGAE